MSLIRVIDLEVENHEHLGAKASPYCEENYIVAPGWQDYTWAGEPVDTVQHRYFTNRKDAESEKWFDLTGVDFLVAHNAMFELSWFFARYRDEMMKFLARGGRVFCTQLSEYVLSHQTHLYPSLEEVAVKYGGTQKVDGIKILWEQGHLTSEIDKDLLLEYLAGPEGDVANTAKTFFGQRSALNSAGMWNMYMERCEGMLAYALCENAGLYVNQEVAEANLKEQEAELAKINEEINKLLPELPEYFEFNWGSLYHVSALLFGGPIKYKERVPYDPPKYEKVDCYKFGDQYANVALFPDGESDGGVATWEADHGPLDRYKSGKNKGLPKVHKVDSDVEKLKWSEALFRFPGIINRRDLPALVQENFDPKRGDWVSKLELPDGTPVYSTSGEVLDVLSKHGFEAAGLLKRQGELVKDNGTYYRRVEYNKDGSVKKVNGMLQYVGADSIIHHKLNITATVTGRLSSSTPNLQNLPRDGTSKVKQMFTSRFGDEGRIIECDYTALEVVMNAALSGDMNLLNKLLDGTDMHTYRLAGKHNNWNGLTYEEMLAILDDKTHPRHKEVKQARTDIKPRAFAAQYGASAVGIAYNTGCTVEEAQEFLDNEASLFPESIAYRDVIYEAVQKSGERNLHREMNEHGQWAVYHRGHWQSPGGTCYSFREYQQWRDGQQVLDYKPTQIANYWNQGEAGFLMTVSAGRVARWLIGQQFFANQVFPEGRAYLVNHVHDALYLDVHESVVREVGLAVRRIMEDAPKYMSARLGYEIAHVPFPCVAEAGPSMYSKDVIK
jgi:DNA polymerase I-like protein with 3'-5' exonuclease and polymerase domains